MFSELYLKEGPFFVLFTRSFRCRLTREFWCTLNGCWLDGWLKRGFLGGSVGGTPQPDIPGARCRRSSPGGVQLAQLAVSAADAAHLRARHGVFLLLDPTTPLHYLPHTQHPTQFSQAHLSCFHRCGYPCGNTADLIALPVDAGFLYELRESAWMTHCGFSSTALQ